MPQNFPLEDAVFDKGGGGGVSKIKKEEALPRF